jgi:hypothetical protein
MGHALERKLRKGLWWGHLKERHPVTDLGVDGGIILKYVSIRQDGSLGSGFL